MPHPLQYEQLPSCLLARTGWGAEGRRAKPGTGRGQPWPVGRNPSSSGCHQCRLCVTSWQEAANFAQLPDCKVGSSLTPAHQPPRLQRRSCKSVRGCCVGSGHPTADLLFFKIATRGKQRAEETCTKSCDQLPGREQRPSNCVLLSPNWEMAL